MLSIDRSTNESVKALEERVTKLEAQLPAVEMRALDAEMQAVVSGSQASLLRDALLRLTNQVAIVAATLGSAIHALKRGDAQQSTSALADALDSQARLGAMLNEISGKHR